MTAKEYRDLAATKLRIMVYECVTNNNPLVPKQRAEEVVEYMALAAIKGLEEKLITPEQREGARHDIIG
ncbi:MAG: hypothetical protein ACK53W_00020 [Gemmatimonadota bacterium]|jgi:hypothetical protein